MGKNEVLRVLVLEETPIRQRARREVQHFLLDLITLQDTLSSDKEPGYSSVTSLGPPFVALVISVLLRCRQRVPQLPHLKVPAMQHSPLSLQALPPHRLQSG